MTYLFLKRVVDLLLAFIALLVLFPFFILIIVILLLTGEGEVFYLQDRLGYHNKKFKIIKFATMVKNSPNIGTGSLTLRGDPRVLPVGKFLRKSKLNELPQIFNVIIGNMSIVGPRPQMQGDFDKFPTESRNLIYKSKPGITGIGSIVFRDEEIWISNHSGDKHQFYQDMIAPYKAQLELWYLNKSSLSVDFSLIFITAWVIIFPKSNLVNKAFKSLPKRPTHLI
tara:strand:- start:751 stop:1425 length:675 start_codon:yes stop_codon:yes gene_type:complete